jgi:hypothetical protein
MRLGCHCAPDFETEFGRESRKESEGLKGLGGHDFGFVRSVVATKWKHKEELELETYYNAAYIYQMKTETAR